MADLTNAFKSIRQSNDKEVTASYTTSEVVVEDGRERLLVDVTNAKLHPYMYDATTISVENIPELEMSNPDIMKRCWLSINEILGENRELTFNLGTRLDKDGLPITASVFYDTQFVYNSQEDRYELTIYIPAKCSDGTDTEGFDDSYVLFECTEPESHIPEEPDPENPYVLLSVTGQYITALPPLIVQGKAKKKDPGADDPVFPPNADRCSIGEGTIPSYYENSQGYTKDYLFTNADPIYHVLTSGFIPDGMKEQVAFANVSGYLMDELTEAVNMLPTELQETKTETMDVMTILDGQSSPMRGDFEVSVWETQIKNDWAASPENRTTIKNVVTVSAQIQRL